MRLPAVSLWIAFFIISFSACTKDTITYPFVTDIDTDDLKQHLTFLASDSLKGRDAGSFEETIAANYLADHFTHFGLSPAGIENTFFQEFSIITGIEETELKSRMSFGDFDYSSADSSVFPYPYSAKGSASGSLVFAGYGIDAPKVKYDDYAKIDVKDKIVMILRYGPDGNSNPHSDFGAFWPEREKIKRAIEKGAAAVLFVQGPSHGSKDDFIPLKVQRMMQTSEIPVLQVSLSTATLLASEAGFSLTTVQKKIDQSKKPFSIETEYLVSLDAGVQPIEKTAKNVLAMVKGTAYPDSFLIIGAHYDHLGMGDEGSLYAGKEPKIHNGADDNGSGTVGLLELAHYFSKNPIKQSIIFQAYSGEEKGLLGSDHFVKNPTIDLKKVTAMINMDMIGRMTNKSFQIFGTGSAKQWESVIDTANVDSLTITKTPDGVGASDHTSFYHKEIPVLHYFTGTHADYHRPSDDAEYVNFSGLAQVLTHVVGVVEFIDSQEKGFIPFTEAPVTQRQRMTMSGITLGVLPDYAFSGKGFRINGVSDGRLGEKLGLKGGDVIVEIQGQSIGDIYDYMGSLNSIQKGKMCKVVVERDKKTLTLQTMVE